MIDMGHDVFISHSSKDNDIALKLYNDLKTAGIHCWIDDLHLKSGSTFSDEIVNAILDSKIVVLAYTANVNQSEIVLNEIAIAHNNKKKIISFKLEDVEYRKGLQLYLTSSQYIGVYHNTLDESTQQLIKDIKEVLGIFDSKPITNQDEYMVNIKQSDTILTGRVLIRNTNTGVGNASVSIIVPATKTELVNSTTDLNGVYQISLKGDVEEQLQIYACSKQFGEGYSDFFSANKAKAIVKNIHLVTDMRVLGESHPTVKTVPGLKNQKTDVSAMDIDSFNKRLEKYLRFQDFSEYSRRQYKNRENIDKIKDTLTIDGFRLFKSKYAEMTVYKSYNIDDNEIDILVDIKLLSKYLTNTLQYLNTKLAHSDETEIGEDGIYELEKLTDQLYNLRIIIVKYNIEDTEKFITRYNKEAKEDYLPFVMHVINHQVITSFLEKGV